MMSSQQAHCNQHWASIAKGCITLRPEATASGGDDQAYQGHEAIVLCNNTGILLSAMLWEVARLVNSIVKVSKAKNEEKFLAL